MGGLYDGLYINGKSLGNKTLQDVAYCVLSLANGQSRCAQQRLLMCGFWCEIIGLLNEKLIVAQQNIIVVHIIVGVYPMSEQQFVTLRIHVMGCGIVCE